MTASEDTAELPQNRYAASRSDAGNAEGKLTSGLLAMGLASQPKHALRRARIAEIRARKLVLDVPALVVSHPQL